MQTHAGTGKLLILRSELDPYKKIAWAVVHQSLQDLRDANIIRATRALCWFLGADFQRAGYDCLLCDREINKLLETYLGEDTNE